MGRAIRSDLLVAKAGGNRRAAMDALGLTIARLLPRDYRGAYDGAGAFPDARELLTAIGSEA